MVNFGLTIAKAQYEPWRVGYIDYEMLKAKLDQKLQCYTHAAINMKKNMSFSDTNSGTPFRFVRKTLSFGNLNPTTSVENQIEKKEFEIFLESELEKTVLFFLKMQGELADRLVAAKELQGAMTVIDLDSLTEVYHSIGEQILLLVKFADINVTAVRKILKKHDKHFRHAPLSYKYCETSHLPERESTIEPLNDFSGIFALILALHRGMARAARLDVLRWEIEHPVRLRVQSREHLEDMPFLNSSLIEYDPVLAKLERVRTRRLHQASAYTKNLAAMSLLFIQEPEIDGGSESDDLGKPTVSEISRLLNHLSAFLYMANYYIVAPTSGKPHRYYESFTGFLKILLRFRCLVSWNRDVCDTPWWYGGRFSYNNWYDTSCCTSRSCSVQLVGQQKLQKSPNFRVFLHNCRKLLICIGLTLQQFIHGFNWSPIKWIWSSTRYQSSIPCRCI